MEGSFEETSLMSGRWVVTEGRELGELDLGAPLPWPTLEGHASEDTEAGLGPHPRRVSA